VNLALREAGERWLDVPSDQPVLSMTSVIAATVAGVFLACLAIAALGHTQARPFTIFRRLAGWVFLLSCVGPLLAFAGWLPLVDRLSAASMALLIGMNAATTIVCIAVFSTIPRARMPRRRF
jgi:hypothetical protein